MICNALPNTLILALPSTMLAAMIGSWLGIVSAARAAKAERGGDGVARLLLDARASSRS